VSSFTYLPLVAFDEKCNAGVSQAPKIPKKQVGARKPTWLSKDDRESQNSFFAAKWPGLGCTLRLAVLQVKPKLG